MYIIILTVTGSLRFSIDSHRLTSASTSLIHWASKRRVSNSASSCLNFKGTDEVTLMQSLIVMHFVVELSKVLPCARFRAQIVISLFLLL